MDGAGERLPVAVVGAGPVGLAAAAHLHARGERFVVLEAGDAVGASVREWAHVRLFSPWRYLVDPVARGLLEAHGWVEPDPDAHPKGGELVADYLEPLGKLPELAPGLLLGRRVVGITREGFDKLRSDGRETAPFLVTVAVDGRVEQLRARAVVDASGTWHRPNPLGGSGLPAMGERELAGRIAYRIPDVRREQRARYAGRATLVVGSGHSAFNALLDLAALADEVPGTRVGWALRRAAPGPVYGGGADDALAARGALGERVRRLVEDGKVELTTGFLVDRLSAHEGRVLVHAGGRTVGPVDEIIAATGFRPDRDLLGELRVELDAAVEAPTRLAPLIDPSVHSCGTVPPHGAAELAHPEPGLYVVGMKSYGRAPTFLTLTGYEQVRSVVAALAGDEAAAAAIELELPGTGVCSIGSGEAEPTVLPQLESVQGGAAGCCG